MLLDPKKLRPTKGCAVLFGFQRTGGGGMIRHRLLCLGYFDFGSVGLFNLGFLSLFAAYAQQSQNAAQSSQPTDVVAAVTGLRTLGGVVISWLIGVIITAACIVGVAAVGELVDDRILAVLGAANGAFLVLDAGGLLGSGLVDHPLEAVCCRVGLVAALALMPVVGAVILPLCTVAVGMIAARAGIGAVSRTFLQTVHSLCLAPSAVSVAAVSTIHSLAL